MPEIVIKSETQKVAEAKVEGFRSDLGPFVVAAETTRMAMLFMDAKEPGNPIIFANDAFLDLTGYDREEVLGQCFNFLMARGTDPDSLARIDIAFAGIPKGGSEICYRRKDGGEFWSAILISPVRDQSGDVVQHFASFVDLTDHKQEQAQSRMLIDELNHRVKNTLATVQSIVWQALRNTTDPEVIRESIGSRLSALARSHDLLTHENWEGAGLLDLVKAALEPFGVANGRSERFGQEYPGLTEGRPCSRHRVSRTRDQCREIRLVFNQIRISPNLMGDRAASRGQSDSFALAGKERPARDATVPEGVRHARD